MDFVQATISILEILAKHVGGYGWAIIIITFIVRGALWKVNVDQQKSMRTMQQLQPKMKAIQDRYKNNPQMMQQKMMEFYKENKFSPFSGCLPLLIQLPVFILLYSALMSPQFIQIAGNSSFFFINRLDNTLKSSSGVSNDGTFAISQKDTFAIPGNIDVVMKNGETVKVKVKKPQKAVEIQGDINPGKNVDFKIALDNINLSFEELNNIAKATIPVIDNATKEVENVEFNRNESILTATMPTNNVKRTYHTDVLILIILFALSMWYATKLSTSMTKNTDPTQQAMQKTMGTTMPIMITVMFIFFPIPAGVLLYLIVSNAIQIVQTVVINKQLERAEEAKKSTQVIDNTDLSNAKKIEPKSINDDKQQ